MAIICYHCGQMNGAEASVCGACGRVLPAVPPEAMAVTGTGHLVGHQLELQILERMLDEALFGHGSLAMLVGEAGIGKTWMAREFSQHAARRGALALRGSCREGDWQPPYGPWVEAIRKYVSDSEAGRLLRELGAFAPTVAQLVPEVRVKLPDTPLPTPLSPDEERVRLYDAVIQILLTASKERPVVLVLDDLHWADRDSLQLLRHLARLAVEGRLLVVGIYREPELGVNSKHALSEVLAELRREVDYQHIAVQGFAYEELTRYLAETLGQPPPETLAAHIHSETKGNPFYVREIVKSLTERDETKRTARLLLAGLTIHELGIPQGVRQVVDQRVSRLSDQAQTLLTFAAAFTGGFQLIALQSLSDLSEVALLNALDEVLEAGFIQVLTKTPPTYDFAHAIVRHTLYDKLNPDRQVRLHRRIAEVLEEMYSGHELEHASELASQYHASASVPGAAKGIPYALTAADQARAAFAHERVVDSLRMARDLATGSKPALRAEVLCRLAVAEAEALMLEEAERSVYQALAALGSARVKPGLEAEFLAETARVLKDGGARPTVWEPLVERGLGLLADRRDLTWARLELLRDRFETVSGGPITAVRCLGANPQAVAIALAYGGEDDYARTLQPAVWRSYEETEAAIKAVRSWKQPAARMRVLDAATRDLVELHYALREAVERFRELLDLSARCGSIPGQAEAFFQMAGTWIMLGEFALAQQAADRARELIARLGPVHRLQAIEGTLAIIQAYYLDAEWDKAFAAIKGLGETMAGQARNPFALAGTAGVIVALARVGKATEARQLLAVLTPVAMRIEPTARGQNAVVTGAASAAWDLGLVEYAAIYRDLALKLIESNVGGGPIGPNELAAARMAALLGDFSEASEYFGDARRVVDALEMKHLRAIVDYDEALALVRGGTADNASVTALLDSALRGFRENGMEGWERRALVLKEKTAVVSHMRTQAEVAHRRRLTPREIQVLSLVAGGKTNKEIATELTLSTDTVERHVANIYVKIGVHGRAAATAYAISQGIVDVAELHRDGHAPT